MENMNQPQRFDPIISFARERISALSIVESDANAKARSELEAVISVCELFNSQERIIFEQRLAFESIGNRTPKKEVA